MNVRKKTCLAIAVAAAGLVGSFLIVSQDAGGEVEEKNPRPKLTIKDKSTRGDGMAYVRSVVAGRGAKSAKGGKRDRRESVDAFAHMKPADRKLAMAVQEALDMGDFAAVSAAVRKALKSADPEVRENAVEALGWFGAEALPELTPILADKNDDVADAAASHWQLALSEIEEDSVRVKIAESAMPLIYNRTALEMIVSEITGQSDNLKIVQSLVNLMDCDNPLAADVAKEEYESLTGEAWTGIDTAEAWLQENYEPDED